MYDLYQANRDDTARYILGKEGPKKIFVIGLNPSTAHREKSDTTVAKVERVICDNGYSGFVMANLYPLRSTEPTNLPEVFDKSLFDRNIRKIIEMARAESDPVFWAAWGGNIRIRPYLIEAYRRLNRRVMGLNGCWVHYGDLLKHGHPRHPSRLSYRWEFHTFDGSSYETVLKV